MSLEEQFTKLLEHTNAIVENRIKMLVNRLNQLSKEARQLTFGKVADFGFKLGGLFGKTIVGAERAELDQIGTSLEGLHALQIKLRSIQSRGPEATKDLAVIRSDLGMPAVLAPSSSSLEFYRQAVEAQIGRDRSLEVDYATLNAQLAASEAALNGWEVALQSIDTATGLAAGFVPGGGELHTFIRCTGDVASGTKTPQEAATEFAINVVASRMGGKLVSKAKIDAYVSGWVRKNATYFSKPVADKLAAALGNVAKGTTETIVSKTIEGGAKGTATVVQNELKGRGVPIDKTSTISRRPEVDSKTREQIAARITARAYAISDMFDFIRQGRQSVARRDEIDTFRDRTMKFQKAFVQNCNWHPSGFAECEKLGLFDAMETSIRDDRSLALVFNEFSKKPGLSLDAQDFLFHLERSFDSYNPRRIS